MKKNYVYFVYAFVILLYGCSCSDYGKNLGEGYFYRFEAKDLTDILCERSNSGEIPANVIAYDYNHQYIIAKQKPKLPPDPLYSKEYVYLNGSDSVYYWLIIKKEHCVLGPMNLDEFKMAKAKYNVPDDLKLE